MKNLLLLLLLANILYFVWGMLGKETAEPGVAIVNESDLGPPLAVSANRDAGAASVGAVLGSGEPSALEAVVGRSCVTVGPFRAATDADTAQTQYAEKVELQAKSLGLPAEITPRTREDNIFFVDIGLPPGKGAGAIVEQYGEDKVLLRDQATCPKSQ
jgi:ABC-type Na+ efflux pump permease subunit